MNCPEIHSLPDDDPRKIFFRLEDDILAIVEYVALLVPASLQELDNDGRAGMHRLTLDIQDHALAIREGFRKAFLQAGGVE